MRGSRSTWERVAIAAAAIVLAVVAVYALVAALSGMSQRTLERDSLVVLAPVLLVGAGALAAWWSASRRVEARARALADAEGERQRLGREALEARERALRERERLEEELARVRAGAERLERELDQARAAAERLEEELAQSRAAAERLEHEGRRREQLLARERELNARLQQSRRAEREWNRELRSQLQRLEDEHGMLAQSEDPRVHILRAAIELVNAKRGLLLARTDEDGDGDLDLLVSHGFEHDAEHSAVAQRFARQVLDRDETIRENDPTGGDAPLTPADREIESLVAVPLYLRDEFAGVVVLANRPGGFDDVDDDQLLALGDNAGSAIQSSQLRNELHETHRATLRMLTEATAARDPVLQLEASELAVHATALARELGLSEHDRDVLVCAALVRDVGHLAMAGQILLKPGPLSAEERAIVELHPRIGFNVVRQLPALREVAFVLLYHHERWDGTGYPAGLVAESIPFLSRALAALDSYNAMVHDRPYRPGLSREEALEQLVAGGGTQFDPEIVQLLVEHLRRAPTEPREGLIDHVIAEALPLGAGTEEPGLLGELSATATDGLTLLGNHRSLQETAHAAAQAGQPFSIILLQLEDLPRINAEASYLAGDRLIQTAGRHVQRAAVRTGATAFRASGRRLALLINGGSDGRPPEDLVEEVRNEFLAGPSVRLTLAQWRPGESGTEVIERARAALATATT